MGTNYYWHEKLPCSHCTRPYDGLHIGKSSGGWCFSLHVIADEGINCLEDWVDRFRKDGSYIVDEYGDEVSVDSMLSTITDREGRHNFSDKPLTKEERRYCTEGPHGLVRHVIGNGCCIAHGPGTWDLLDSEFS